MVCREYYLRELEKNWADVDEIIIGELNGERLYQNTDKQVYFISKIPSALVHTGQIVRLYGKDIDTIKKIKSKLEEKIGIKFETIKEHGKKNRN